MLYKLEVVEIDLEKVLVTGLCGGHSVVALPLFPEGGLVGGTTTPMAVRRPLSPVLGSQRLV